MISSQLQIILLFEFYSANNTNILPDSGNVDLNPHCLLGGFHALQNSSRQLPWQMSCCKQGSPQREVGHQRELCLPLEINPGSLRSGWIFFFFSPSEVISLSSLERSSQTFEKAVIR
jgi:hypothetical protein